MFQKIFNPDSGLMITMTQITDCIFLSLFWLLGCAPVVTAGASFAALYDASFRAFRRGEKHSWQRFASVYKANWKGSILPTILFLAVVSCGAWGMVQIWNGAVYGNISWKVFAAAAFFGVLLLGILSILFPMLSRFENPTGTLLKNTLFLALANLPRTLLLGAINAGAVWLCLKYVIPLFILPSLAALLGSLLIEPMFRPYMPETEG